MSAAGEKEKGITKQNRQRCVNGTEYGKRLKALREAKGNPLPEKQRGNRQQEGIQESSGIAMKARGNQSDNRRRKYPEEAAARPPPGRNTVPYTRREGNQGGEREREREKTFKRQWPRKLCRAECEGGSSPFISKGSSSRACRLALLLPQR